MENIKKSTEFLFTPEINEITEINGTSGIIGTSNEMEQLTDRYIEAEKFIMELNWIERLFCSRKITKFLKSRLVKYNF